VATTTTPVPFALPVPTHPTMEIDIVILNLTELQLLSRRGARLSPDQRMSVARLRQETPAPILAHFDEVLEQGRKGIAEVRHGVCAGCYLKLPTSLMAAAGGGDLVVCENCGAYLAFVGAESTAGLVGTHR